MPHRLCLPLVLLLGRAAFATPPTLPYAEHLRKVRQTIKVRRLVGHFTVVVQPPFVVIGDDPPAAVRRRAHQTVKWAVDRLKQEYFTRDPSRIIDIWLFRNERSYNLNTIRLSGKRPGTPYGFYSEELDALVMNIATGGGTLVHEIVHPFVEANFPNAPPWLNEGLGSLYEACGEEHGRIRGYTNWRLPDLQQAIRRRAVPSFRWLTSRTTEQFYGQDPGTNYSQSRYLLYYLQEQGLLQRFYRAFLARRARSGGAALECGAERAKCNRAQDPGGYETLKQVLGQKEMQAFQRIWEAYVLRLRWAQ